MSQIVLARKGEKALDDSAITGMYRLRHAVFHDRLKWDVGSDNGLERDVFDSCCNPVYMLVRSASNDIEGCWRLLPTTGPYMLKDVFPQLLYGKPAPAQHGIWELSRFALSSDKHDESGYGFSGTSIRMMQSVVQFALENGIDRYVTVTTVGVERLMRKLGIHIERFGPAMRIGNAVTVALNIEIDFQTQIAVFGKLPDTARIAA